MRNKMNVISRLVVTILVISASAFSKESGAVNQKSVAKVSEGVNQNPGISVMNINNHAFWVAKDGAYTTGGSNNGVQGDYPKFTGGLIFADGMLWGAKMNDHLGGTARVGEVRVGGSTYGHGLKAGRVIYDNSNNVIGADDPTNNHVWRVRKDYADGNLTEDAANFFGVDVGSVTDDQVEEVRSQYEYDWENWPGAWGAPYEDVDGDGNYDHTVDIPGYPGADQTVWTIANDVPTIVDASGAVVDTIETAQLLYGADPIGVELQITVWGYAFGASDPLGNVIFKKADMVYTGLPETPDSSYMDSVYFTQWSDPDLGTFTDDYVGCDVDLSYGYVYNGNRLDGVFNGIYNLPVPSGGYDFLQGPPDNMDIDGDSDTTEYLGMTSFTYFGAGSSISDPDLQEYAGSLQFYNLMEGYLPRPEYPVQIPWTDLSTGEDTKFVLSGDPVTQTGWIDGVQLPPGDRRMVMASGPFKMQLGDSATVVVGIIGGMGLDNISSVSVGKFHDKFAQYAYDQDFNLPSAPTPPSVAGLEMDGSISLDWGSDASAYEATENTVNSGFEFEGYNVYQLPSATSPLSEAVKVATYDKVNAIQNILDAAIDPVTSLELQVAKQTGSNSGVQRYFHSDYDEIRGRPMSNGITYHFAVTAYSYLPDNEGRPFKTLESGASKVAVTPHSMDPGFVYDQTGSAEVTHNGTADASVEVHIANTEDLVGGDYEVYFDEQLYELDLNGVWTPITGSGRVADVSGTTLEGSAVSSVNVGTIDINFQLSVSTTDYNCVQGVRLVFPDGTVINSADGGTIDGTAVLFGEDVANGGGAFCAAHVLSVNINTPEGFGLATAASNPISVAWTAYDDDWAQLWCVSNCATCDYYEIGTGCEGEDGSAAIVHTLSTNAEGNVDINELSYFVTQEYHWNLRNTTTGQVVRENQTFINGSDLYGGNSIEQESAPYVSYGNDGSQPYSEGFQIFVNGNYEAPTDAFARTFTYDNAAAAAYGASSYDVDAYPDYGWATTALSYMPDHNGVGVTDVNILQRDIEVRWTGEYEDSIFVEMDGGPSFWYYTCGTDENGDCIGGSYAWISGARYYDIAVHPDPGNLDKDGAPFRIWIPFEVWDMEALDANGAAIEGGQQIDVDIYDRIQDPTDADAPGNPDDPGYMYSFNPYNRMYTYFIHAPYDISGQYEHPVTGDPSGFYTWNSIFWESQFNVGDVLYISYANPLQLGSDTFTFSTTAKSTTTDYTLDNVSVYPNPYYGYHDMETSRGEKYVSFNNLPAEATLDIYSLGGVYVRSLEHGVSESHSNGQHVKWDLNNQYGYPVASGMYIVRVSADGKEKILKLAVVQETQVLKYY